MDWVSIVRELWLPRLAWLTGLAVVFAVLARLMPCNRGMYWWKDLRAAVTDLMYWLVVPLFLHVCLLFLLGLGVRLFFAEGYGPDRLPTRQLPVWLQVAAILLVQDALLYWAHRAFHGRLGWRFHAIHHSPKVLDWMSTQRFHPVNDLFAFVLADVVILLAGFSPAVTALLVPFNIAYSAMVHANVGWTFGPFRFVLASPVFHRWHHTLEEEGLDKNFAPTFPFLDLVFGTFYMPPGKLPEHFGNGEPDFPEGFWGQLVYPVVKSDGSPGRRAVAATTCGVVGVVSLLLVALHLVRPVTQRPHQGEEESEVASVPTPVDPVPARPVLAVALSADGRRAASASEDSLVTLWDTATKTATRTLKGHARGVRAVALSRDGSHVVSGGQDGSVRLWNADTGTQVLLLQPTSRHVLGVAVSADGNTIAAACVDGQVKAWDARTGAEQFALKADAGAFVAVSLSGDGEQLALASGRTAKVWRVPASRQTLALQGHADLVYSVAFSGDGRALVTGSFDLSAKVWDARTGEARCSLAGHAGPVYGVAADETGRTVVTGDKDGAVMVWEGSTGRLSRSLASHADSVTGVAISRDGRVVVSGGRDGAVQFHRIP